MTRRCWVIGSGPSAKSVDLNRIPAADLVIGVNGTIEWTDRLDWWFTLDSDSKNIQRMRERKPRVLYLAALPARLELPVHVVRYERIAVGGRDGLDPEPEPSPRYSPEWWAWRWSATPKLCDDHLRVHTGGSLWGALQIAYQYRRTPIVFVGLDGTQAERVGGGRPNNLSHLPKLFQSALPQLKAKGVTVLNANPDSKITCFLRMTFDEALRS